MLTQSIWAYIGVNADTLSSGSKKRVVHQGKSTNENQVKFIRLRTNESL